MVMTFEGRWMPSHSEHEHTHSNYQKQLKHRRKTREDVVCPECREEGRKYTQSYRLRTGHAGDHKYSHRKAKADLILRQRHLPEWKAIMALLAEGEDPT